MYRLPEEVHKHMTMWEQVVPVEEPRDILEVIMTCRYAHLYCHAQTAHALAEKRAFSL